jgi:hypothetical protein
MKLSDPQCYAVAEEDQSRYSYDFSDFLNIPTKTDYTLITIGSGTKIYDLYENMVMFWTELPNCLIHAENSDCEYHKTFKVQDKFIKILTDCPFSCEYFNKKYNYDKFQHVFLPINLKYVPPQTDKFFDVFYTGHNFNSPIRFSFRMLSEKFKFCSVGRDHAPYSGVSYKDKLFLNSKSKISIVHGLLEWQNTNVISQFKYHKAFDLLNEYKMVPQFKTRTLEAAMSRSLILSFKDPWNMIESYFEKDEFMYWTDLKDLEEKVNHIITHYDDYTPMIEKAYNRVVNNYTREIFFEKFLKNI